MLSRLQGLMLALHMSQTMTRAKRPSMTALEFLFPFLKTHPMILDRVRILQALAPKEQFSNFDPKLAGHHLIQLWSLET